MHSPTKLGEIKKDVIKTERVLRRFFYSGNECTFQLLTQVILLMMMIISLDWLFIINSSKEISNACRSIQIV